ncbi:periplasmic heavy metal sensor [Thalassococcus lentus]|uniref:Periplasmic heavy metal sensor n=1 Tax=Thalassococcus lentus TaxID=1210524 RepID=A0ABT4XWQ8_9RHOB|nr:periplasmic heavy metal sensor [Thalassococcus lentus]MDA7426386.1 periplasmic heavy metal sensor [Thalassococcus lentus]
MAPTETDTPKRGTRPWVKGLLFASLALNLLVVGLVAGAVINGGPPGKRDAGYRDAAGPYMRAFSDDQRRTLRKNLRDGFKAGRDGRPAIMAGYQQGIAVLRADPFDPKPLEEILTEQARSGEERRLIAQGVMIEFIAQMDAAERQALADRLEEQIKRFKGRKKRD